MAESEPSSKEPRSPGLLYRLRPLRVALILAALITILLRPEAGAELSYQGWAMVRTLLMPVLAPLFFMLLMLDALMTRVWLSGAGEEERLRLRLVVRADLLTGLLLLLVWLPFFIQLGR